MIAAVAIALHALAATIWVGGMFFAYMALRPAAGGLEAAVRLALWRGVFDRFFPWVWGAVVALLVTGYWMVFEAGGFAAVGVHVHVMQVVAWAMMLKYAFIYFVPYRRLAAAVDRGETAAGAPELARIRRLMAINLTLGLIVVAVAAGGRYWG